MLVSTATRRGVNTEPLRLAAHLDDLRLAHHRVAMHMPRQPQNAVGDGEHRARLFILGGILANQERGGLPACHLDAERLHEIMQALLALRIVLRLQALLQLGKKIVGGKRADILSDPGMPHPCQPDASCIKRVEAELTYDENQLPRQLAPEPRAGVRHRIGVTRQSGFDESMQWRAGRCHRSSQGCRAGNG